MRKQKDDQKESTSELETVIANHRNQAEAGHNNGSTSRGNEELLRIRSNLINNDI